MLRKRHNGSIHRPDSQQAVKSPPLLVRNTIACHLRLFLFWSLSSQVKLIWLCVFHCRTPLTKTVNRLSNSQWVHISFLLLLLQGTLKRKIVRHIDNLFPERILMYQCQPGINYTIDYSIRLSWTRCLSEGSAPPTRQTISAAMISMATMLSRESEMMICNPRFTLLPFSFHCWDDKDYKLSRAEPSGPHRCLILQDCSFFLGGNAALSSQWIFCVLSFRLWRLVLICILVPNIIFRLLFLNLWKLHEERSCILPAVAECFFPSREPNV